MGVPRAKDTDGFRLTGIDFRISDSRTRSHSVFGNRRSLDHGCPSDLGLDSRGATRKIALLFQGGIPLRVFGQVAERGGLADGLGVIGNLDL